MIQHKQRPHLTWKFSKFKKPTFFWLYNKFMYASMFVGVYWLLWLDKDKMVSESFHGAFNPFQDTNVEVKASISIFILINNRLRIS